MDDELEVIRDEMEETRASLATKLEALESQVHETVASTSETVTSTVEGVKDVVENVTDTVGTVTETLNISKHIEEHPWAAMGIALGVGFMAGQMLGGSGSSRPEHQPRSDPHPQPPPPPQPQPQAQKKETPSSEDQQGILPSFDSLLPGMDQALNTALAGANGLAIGTVMGVVREVVANGLPPEWKTELTRVVDSMTSQLGGKPLKAEPRTEDNEDKSKDDEVKPLPRRPENPTEPTARPESKRKIGRAHV